MGITTQTKIDYDKIVRGVAAKIGFDSYVDDLSSVDSKGLSDKTCEVLVRINKQSPDLPIVGGTQYSNLFVNVGGCAYGWRLGCGMSAILASIIGGTPSLRFGNTHVAMPDIHHQLSLHR